MVKHIGASLIAGGIDFAPDPFTFEQLAFALSLEALGRYDTYDQVLDHLPDLPVLLKG